MSWVEPTLGPGAAAGTRDTNEVIGRAGSIVGAGLTDQARESIAAKLTAAGIDT